MLLENFQFDLEIELAISKFNWVLTVQIVIKKIIQELNTGNSHKLYIQLNHVQGILAINLSEILDVLLIFPHILQRLCNPNSVCSISFSSRLVYSTCFVFCRMYPVQQTTINRPKRKKTDYFQQFSPTITKIPTRFPSRQFHIVVTYFHFVWYARDRRNLFKWETETGWKTISSTIRFFRSKLR